MTTSLEAIQAEVARLSPSERARLLEHLIASLDAEQEIEAAWDAVADQRELELAGGKVKSVPFEEAIARLEARFAE